MTEAEANKRICHVGIQAGQYRECLADKCVAWFWYIKQDPVYGVDCRVKEWKSRPREEWQGDCQLLRSLNK